jgi:hypothetical protein
MTPPPSPLGCRGGEPSPPLQVADGLHPRLAEHLGEAHPGDQGEPLPNLLPGGGERGNGLPPLLLEGFPLLQEGDDLRPVPLREGSPPGFLEVGYLGEVASLTEAGDLLPPYRAINSTACCPTMFSIPLLLFPLFGGASPPLGSGGSTPPRYHLSLGAKEEKGR